MPQGCSPPQLQARFEDFLAAVSTGDAAKATGYIASRSQLKGFTIYYGRGAQAGRSTAHTPHQAYAAVAQLVKGGEHLKLLGAMAGIPGPFAPEHRRATGGNATAAVQFVLGLGGRSASGKFGIDCTTGQFYEWVMDVVRGVQKQKVCGRYVQLHARKPTFCGP
jgi:hypothetical protein